MNHQQSAQEILFPDGGKDEWKKYFGRIVVDKAKCKALCLACEQIVT